MMHKIDSNAHKLIDIFKISGFVSVHDRYVLCMLYTVMEDELNSLYYDILILNICGFFVLFYYIIQCNF